jgi:hypothetical protein
VHQKLLIKFSFTVPTNAHNIYGSIFTLTPKFWQNNAITTEQNERLKLVVIKLPIKKLIILTTFLHVARSAVVT